MNEHNAWDNTAVAGLNRVEGFDPRALLRTTTTEDGTQGQYLDVKYRKLWFRLAFPQGKIVKFFHKLSEQVAICEARVYMNKDDPEDQYIGSGFAQRMFKPEEKFGDRYVENAETAAVGRALAEAGFGSQFGASEPNDTNPVDTPFPAPQPAQPMPQPAPPIQQPPRPAPMPRAAAPRAAAPQAPAAPRTYDECYAAMTLEQAQNTLVDCGIFRGQRLGQVAINKPESLNWYVTAYKGPNVMLRAAAQYLIDQAMAG